jgi:DNA modification methylase
MAARTIVSAVEDVPLDRLRCWPDNPRLITPARLEDLQRALAEDPEMLRARPLIALPDGTVIAGNQRLVALRALGWPSAPVVVADIGRERARVWALRDNAAYGEWDDEALAELLRELAEGGVDLALTGFEAAELDRLLSGFTPSVDPDAAPPLPEEADSVAGEIYRLGSHRLLCGDATDPDQLAALLEGAQAEVLWTDPPYGLGYVGKTKQALRIANDNAAGLDALLRRAFAAIDTVFAPAGRFYIASPAGLPGLTFRQAVVAAGWQLHQTLVWAKQTPVLSHCDYLYAHEDVLYGWKPGAGRPGRGRHRGSRWYGNNAQQSVFHVDRPARSAEHPTMKPVALIAAMLKNSSRRGDPVLDPFAGSGSTLIACESLGRRCLAVEIDPRYCDVIRRRHEEYHHDQ